MSEVIIGNAFSLGMLSLGEGEEVKVVIRKISLQEVKELLKNGFVTAVGHSSTAQILTQLLQVPVPYNRQEIKLQPGQQLVVFQLQMRLNEGQILSDMELQQLINQGKAAFYLVQLQS